MIPCWVSEWDQNCKSLEALKPEIERNKSRKAEDHAVKSCVPIIQRTDERKVSLGGIQSMLL